MKFTWRRAGQNGTVKVNRSFPIDFGGAEFLVNRYTWIQKFVEQSLSALCYSVLTFARDHFGISMLLGVFVLSCSTVTWKIKNRQIELARAGTGISEGIKSGVP